VPNGKTSERSLAGPCMPTWPDLAEQGSAATVQDLDG
jgi:hypothetical protein